MILARYQKNNKGFTLVELMTVVAIIGALAALGVPQYKKMQRKAKRAEANMVLGVIASAEAAFYAEYNAYGTNMGGIGAEMDNDPQYYNVGFLSNAVQIAPFGGAVGGGNPVGFAGYAAATIRRPMCAGGPAEAPLTRIAPCFRNPAGALVATPPPPGACAQQGLLRYNGARPEFVAVAQGNLYQNTAAAPRADCVTIDNQRIINLEQDGS